MRVQRFGISAHFLTVSPRSRHRVESCWPPLNFAELIGIRPESPVDTDMARGWLWCQSDSIKDCYIYSTPSYFQFAKSIFLWYIDLYRLIYFLEIHKYYIIIYYIYIIILYILYIVLKWSIFVGSLHADVSVEVLSPTRSTSGGRGTVTLQPCLHRPGAETTGAKFIHLWCKMDEISKKYMDEIRWNQ